jgi:hypothetical protein
MATEKTVGQLMDLVVGPQRLGPESLGLAQMRRVLEHSNVVGVGASMKVTRGKTLKDFALSVFVVKKVALSRLRGTAVVPPLISTGTGQTVATDVVEIGVLRPEANVRKRPIQPGYSVGHFSGDTGTLGAIVKRDSKYFLLSNSHVLAMCGKAKKGDLILYPGYEDGGRKSKDKIARLVDFVKLKTRGTNTVDTAIAEIDPDVVEHVTATIRGIGLVRGTIKAKAGMKVTKLGRTSNKTQGKVLSAKFRVLRMPYPGVGNVSFGDQILITRFTAPGDSGSLVVDVKSKKAIGLHFAGAKGGSVSAPIDRVLDLMRVQLVVTGI